MRIDYTKYINHKTQTETPKNNGGPLGGIGYAGEKAAVGLVSGVEGVWDFLAGGTASLFGADKWAERQFANDWFGDWYSHPEEWYNPGQGWKVAGDVTGAIGQMTPSILAAVGIMAIPGVGPALEAVAGAGGVASAVASGAVTAGEIALALLPAATSSTIMGLSAAGSATKDAYRTTGQLTGKEYGYGALVGVTEGAVEMASAGLAKGSGKVISSIGNAVYRNTAKQTVGTVAKTSAKAVFKEAAGNFFWEAVEEGASEFLAPIYQRMTYDPNARNATGQEIAYAALVGGLTGVVMNGMQGGISNAYNAVTATAAGNRAVQNGTAPKILENGRIIAEYQGKNNTAIEVFARATETYNKLTASLSKTGGQITTQAQKRMLGELNRDIVGAVYSTGVYKSAQNYVLNAEALADRISNLGLRDNNGRLVSITAEQLTEGVDMSDLSSPKGVERFQKSLQKAMSQNPVLSWLALNDAVGHILTDTNKIAEAMSVGQSVSRADISRLIEEGSQEDIDAVTSSLGITEDDLRRMSPEELDARGYEFSQTEKGRAIYEANAMFQSVIDGKEGLKKRVSKVLRKDMRDGSYRIEGEGLDVAVIKKGDSYYLYDYKTRRRSRALSLQEANKWLKEARSSEAVSKPTETKKTALREETEQIDAFARENIDNYNNLLSAQKQAVRSTIRQARALGVSEARTLLAARVAARSGMAVIFDTVRTGKDNALYDKGKLFINPEITEAQIYEAILGHEMGHALFDTSRAGKKLMADVLKRIEKSNVISQEEVAKVRERYTDHYKRLGVSESRYKPIVDEEVAMAYMEKIIGVDGAWDYILSKDATWADKVLSFFRKADKDYADIPKMSAEAKRFLKRYKQVFSRLEPSGKVVDYSSLGAGSMRHSISSFAEAAGLKAAHDENGLLVFLDKDGNKVTKITTEHVKSSPLGLMIGIAVDDKRITAEEAGKQYEGVAELFQLIIQTQDPEMVWQFSGAMMFSSVKKNADAQYTTTIDFSTVCRKTQEMIEGMTHSMKKEKRGLTIEEVTRLQKKISEAGGTVPCPVCYVFSRWAGVGGILDNIKRMQTKYEKYNTAQLNQALKDAYDAVVRQVKEIHGRTKKANTKIITELLSEKAEGLTTLQSRLEGLIREKDSGKVITKDGKSIFKAIQMLQKDIDALTVEVDVLSEYSWLGMVRLKKNYKPVPDDVLFDLADPTVFAEEYKDAWKFRTTIGPSAGKAILPYSDFRVGDVISGANVKSKTKVDEETAEETIISRNKTWAEIGETLSKPQKDQVKKAIARAAAQNLIGGQRMQSTSDFRYDYALDYIMAFFEMQAIGSNIQTYTKMVEFVDLVCSVGGDCNMSLMGKDAGYENGKLIFSDVTGMDFETAKRARAKYDNAQTILVGINDEHIRLALLDSEETLGAYVDFVIPYHASGAKTEFIKTLVENLGEKYNKRNYVDYSDVQTDKSKFAEKSAPEDVERMRSLREMILTGKRGKSKFVITDEEISFLREMKEKSASLKGKSFAALRAIEQKAMAGDPKAIEEFKSWSAGVLYDTYMRVRHTESKKETKPTLTKSQAKAIMPHEYWDRTSTRKTAYINGFIFRSYCYSLGFKPRFSGNTKKDIYYGDFTNETGYWKLLIDRPMYDRKGRYREQQACNMTNFDMQMALPSYGQRVWGESKIPEPNLERARRVADEFLAELPNREVTEAVDTERRSLSDDEYLSGEWEEAEARASQGGRSFLDELFFPEEEEKINYEEVLKHPPRKPGIAKITRGQAKKTIANHTLRKVYSLEETRKIVSGIYQIEHLKKKDFEYISQIVWQVLNESGGMQIDHRTHLFERTAQYIVAKLIFDTKVDNTKSQEYTQLLERMSVLGIGIQKLDFGRAEAELRNLLDKDYAKFATRWRNKGYIGLPIDSWVQELSTVDGSLSYLSDMHPADALVEIDRIYTETKSELMDTKTVSALEDLQPEYYKELETEIYSLLVQAWNKGGTRSAFASAIEPLESRIKFLTAALSESREYNTYTNLCLKYVEKLKAEKNGTYLRATDFRGDDPSHPIFALKKIAWNGGVVNAESVGNAVATFNKWYASKEAKEILGTKDGLWSEKIAELAGELGATRFGKKDKLTLAQLKDLSTILAHANAIVRNLTRQYRNGQLVFVSDEAYGSYDIVADNARILGDSVFSGGAFGYTRETSDPSALVKKWDGYNPNGLFTKTFADIRRGEIDAEYEKMRILSEMDDFLHDHKKFLDTERTKTVEIDINGRKHKLTRMELIGLYMTSLRDQSIRGIAYSGVVFERRVGKGAKVETKTVDIPPLFSYLVSDEEMFLRVATFSENLRKELTADEQTYVGILEHIYQECKTLKTTTDIQRLGFTNVLDGYYYPILRFDAGRIEGVVWSHQDAEMALHISANKSTNAKASAALLIGDPDQVMTKHLNSVASYHFLSAPIELYNRVLSYNLEADVDNNERGRFKPGSGQSLRRVISKQAGGRKALQYFNDLLVAVQGGKVTNEGRGAEFISMARGGYAVAALGANLKVLLTQLNAFVAAINELDPRLFAKGIWKSNKGVDDYCHLAAIRNYENAAALAMSVDDLNSSSKKFHRMTMQLGNKLMKGVGAMDRLVITRLFGVCQVQVEKNGGAKVGTEENRIEAGKLLEKVILETQQNALPTERSDWMRNGNLITKTATMFSADAMKSRGRLQDAWGECRVLKKRISAESDASVVSNLKKQLEKAKKKTATALAAIVIQSAYMAVIAEAFKWLYDKDEKNRWDLPKWANFLIDVAAGCFGGMPLIRDIVDFFVDGFELDNFALDALNGILTTTQEFIDRVTDYEHTSSENWMLWMKNLTFTVGSLCGLPTRNLYNLVVGLTKRISPEAGYKIEGFFKSQNHREALEQAFEDADSDMIFTIIDSAYKDIFGETPDETTTHSIAGLARDYDIFPRRMESLEEYSSMSISQQKQFKEIYSQSWDVLEGIGNNPQWLREDDETKAEIVRCVFDIYFDKACIAVLNKTVSDSDAKRVLLSEYVDPFAVAYASKAGEKKEDLIKKLKGYPNLTNAERTMLYGLRYKLSDADSSVVAGYINKMYATSQEKQLFAQIYGLYYNDRTGRVSPIKK